MDSTREIQALSNNGPGLYRKLYSSWESGCRRLGERHALNVQVFSGSGVSLPPDSSSTGVLEQLDDWIAQHAQLAEAFEVPLDTLEPPPAATNLFNKVWQHLRRIYRRHLKRVS